MGLICQDQEGNKYSPPSALDATSAIPNMDQALQMASMFRGCPFQVVLFVFAPAGKTGTRVMGVAQGFAGPWDPCMFLVWFPDPAGFIWGTQKGHRNAAAHIHLLWLAFSLIEPQEEGPTITGVQLRQVSKWVCVCVFCRRPPPNKKMVWGCDF